MQAIKKNNILSYNNFEKLNEQTVLHCNILLEINIILTVNFTNNLQPLYFVLFLIFKQAFTFCRLILYN